MPTATALGRRLLARPTWPAWIVLAASLAATAGFWSVSRDYVRDEGRQRFDRQVGRIAMAISNQLRIHAQILRGAAGLFEISAQVSREDWHAYVDRLNLRENFLSIQAIGFAELVARDEIRAHVQRMRAGGYPDYEIKPGGERSLHAPAVLVEPMSPPNSLELGFDALSDPARALAIQRALEAGDVAISAEVQFDQDLDVADQSGFLLYMPVFREGIPQTGAVVRPAEIAGYVFACILYADFLGAILGGRQNILRLRVYDGDGTERSAPFFDSAASGAPEREPTFDYGRTIKIGMLQHEWTLQFDALTDDFIAIDAHKPTIVLGAGASTGLVLFILALTIARGQEKIRRGQDELAYLFEKNPGAMWVYCRESLRFLAVNEAATRLYGYSREEFLTLRASDIPPPEEIPRLMAFVATLTDGYQAEGEWRHRKKDGQVFDVEVVSHGLRFAGRPAILSLVDDITDRKRARAALIESERHFRSMADSMPALLAVSDASGEATFVNKPWLEYTGASLEQHLGQAWFDFIHPDDVEQVAQIMQASHRQWNVIRAEYRLRRADGTYRWFADRGVPRFSEDGTFQGHIGVLVDITELREAQAQLRHAQKMEALGQLTGGVAHDFNNLISVILGHAELLGDRFMADERSRRSLRAIISAASRAASLTNRLLAFSRRQQLQPKSIDANELILEIETMLRRTIGEHISIDMRLGESLWRANADPSQLEMAIVNLALNSRDAMPDGGRLLIGTSNVTLSRDGGDQSLDLEPGDYVLLTVTDTGEGIAPSLLEKVFEPFFTTKDVGKGTGLGLSMVFGFVEQTGGRIKIDSELGIGTTVKLYLPRSSEAAADRIAATKADGEVRGGVERILVVEDDAMVRAQVEEQLGTLGYSVVSVPDGPSAIAEIRKDGPIDLLFADVIMPGGMNGRELGEMARTIRPGLRVLYTSGYPEDVFDNDGWEVLAGRILSKPYRRQDLARKVREVLDAPA